LSKSPAIKPGTDVYEPDIVFLIEVYTPLDIISTPPYLPPLGNVIAGRKKSKIDIPLYVTAK